MWQAGQERYSFNADNTFTEQVSTPVGSVKASGTYTLEDPTMTLVPTKIDTDAPDPKMKAMLAEKAASQKGNKQVTTISWTSDDSFTLTAPEGAGSKTFTRSK
jgi:hypothetical protein